MAATTSKIAASTSGGFPIEETHGIPLYPCNRLLAHSGALGWRSLYASYAAEQPWTATLPPLPHPCLAYFVNGGASIRRRVEGEAPQTAQLHARQFGLVPMRASSQWDLQGRPEVLTLYLRQAMVDRLAEEVFGRDPKHVELRPQLGVVDPLLEQLALALLRAMRDGERGADLYVDHLAQTMAVQVLRGHCSGIGAQAPATAMLVSKFTRVLDYIDAAMGGELSLDAMAEVAGMNPFYSPAHSDAGSANRLIVSCCSAALSVPSGCSVKRRRLLWRSRLIVALPAKAISLRCFTATSA